MTTRPHRLHCFFFDHLEYLFVALLFVGVFYLAFTHGSYSQAYSSRLADPDYYANLIFDDSRIHSINLSISGDDWQNLHDDFREKSKYHATVTIDGETFSDVSFSARGNGSLGDVHREGYPDRSNYTINFKKFNSKLSYHGLDKLVLSGLYFEPSYLRTYLSFRLMAQAGADVPLSAFTKFYVNGEYKGLFLAIEAVDQSFLARTSHDSSATLFHPIPYNVDWDRIYADSKLLADPSTLDPDAHPGSSFNTYGGSDLVYRGDDPASYDSIFLNASTKYSQADVSFVISGIESLSGYSLNNPADYWDVDSIIRFFAAATLAPNSDSYLGSLAQNYYLRLANGKLSMIPWDYDRALKIDGFSPDPQADDPLLTWPIDSPTIATEPSSRPLWTLVADNPAYLEAYHSTIQSALDNYLLPGAAAQDLDTAAALIRSSVYSDPTRHYSTEQFENEVAYLHTYLALRTDSLQKQLWNLSPRTREEN